MNLAFNDHERSMRIRFEEPVSDDALLRFSLENQPWGVERDSNGELIVMTPVHSEGGAIEGDVYALTAAVNVSAPAPVLPSPTPPSVPPTQLG